MTEINHIENRDEIVNFLKADLLGPSTIFKSNLNFITKNTNEPIRFEQDENTLGPFLDESTGEEILARYQPLQNYAVGILFTNAMQNNTEKEEESDNEESFEEEAIEEFENLSSEGLIQDSKNSLSKHNEDLDKKYSNSSNSKNEDYEEETYGEIEDQVALANQRRPESIAMSIHIDQGVSSSFKVNITGSSYEKIPTYKSNSYAKQSIKNLYKPDSEIDLNLSGSNKYWVNTKLKPITKRKSLFAPLDGLYHHEILKEFKIGDQFIIYDGKMIKAIGVVNSEPVLTENNPLEDDLEDNVSRMGDWQNRESTSFITVGVEVFQLPIYIPIENISIEEKINENERSEYSIFDKNGTVATKFVSKLSNEFFQNLRGGFLNYWPIGSPWDKQFLNELNFKFSPESFNSYLSEEILWNNIARLGSAFTLKDLLKSLENSEADEKNLTEWLNSMVEINELTFVEKDKTYSLPAVDKLFKNFYIRRPLNYELEIDSKRIINVGTGYLPEAFENEFLIEHYDVKLKVLIYVRKVNNKSNKDSTILTIVLKNISYGKSDENAFFQSKITVEDTNISNPTLLPYPDHLDFLTDYEISEEDINLELLYDDYKTYGVGHGVSVDWNKDHEKIEVFTEFIPTTTLTDMTPNVLNPNTNKPFEISMESLSKSDNFKILEDLISEHRKWGESLNNKLKSIRPDYQKVAKGNISEIININERVKKGLEILNNNDLAKKAFQLANEAMSLQQKTSSKKRNIIEVNGDRNDLVFDSLFTEAKFEPKWRPFQIVFILLNIDSIVNEESEERDIVDLLWFPTGGGKTEAYLGLLAFTIFYRRLFDKEDNGTVSLMRYTYRLLTAQQFQRSAKLICSMEFIRGKNTDVLGTKEFSIGAFVGGSTSPNYKEGAKKHLNKLENKSNEDSKFIVEQCPWCGAQIGKIDKKFIKYSGAPQVQGIDLTDDGRSVQLFCPDIKCYFKKRLPIYVVDEDLYENTPTFILGTVDKFARLMFRPDARSIFGIDEDGNQVKNPPSLIIQDELHLINGALGSTVAFFETVIDNLCTKKKDNKTIRPKVICSTATIKNAEKQIKGIFNRKSNTIFPPVGLTIDDSFFSTKDETSAGKKFVGVAITQYSTQQAQANVLANLNQGPSFFDVDLAKDPWWTNVCYFHSMRELGNTYSILQEDVVRRLLFLRMKFNIGQDQKSYAPNIFNVKELTSRLESPKVVSAMNDLEKGTDSEKLNKVVRNVLATSVIEVGIDIQRLSLLTILGQPKNTSQYIQVAGRVGRQGRQEGVQSARPGLVITIFNPMRPRDRSHFEKFKSYHSKLHSSVEPTSVTPFSINSYERSLYGALFMYLSMKLPKQIRWNENPEFPEVEFNEFKKIIVERNDQINDLGSLDERLNSFLDNIRNLWARIDPSIWEDELEKGDLDRKPLFVQYGSFSSRKHPRSLKVPNSMRNVDETSRAKIMMNSILKED